MWTDLGQPFLIGRLRGAAVSEATAILSTSSVSGVVIVEQIDDHLLTVTEALAAHVAELNQRLGFA